MKLFTLLATIVCSIGFSSIARSQTCSCEAPDTTCTASVTCPRGCTAICGSRDTCAVACSSDERDPLHKKVTIKGVKMNSEEIALELSQQFGKKIEFAPNNPSDRFTMDVKDGLLWNVLEVLSDRGKVKIAGTQFAWLKRIREATLKRNKNR
jgi:hypothetical protein